MGDFNVILPYDYEAVRGAGSKRGCPEFRELMHDCGFLDLGFQGPGETWRRSGVKERLDQVLCNQEWILNFQDSSVVHLPFFSSDHSPLW